MNLLNSNILHSIVSYNDCFYYIDKLYRTNGVYDGVVRIRSIADNSITIRIMFKALTKVSNWGDVKNNDWIFIVWRYSFVSVVYVNWCVCRVVYEFNFKFNYINS